MDDNNFLGKVRLGKFDQMIGWININNVKPNAKGFLNIKIKPMREKDAKGNTHCVVIDTWEPKQKEPKKQENTNEQYLNDDGELPF